jgi:hypothetical protein
VRKSAASINHTFEIARARESSLRSVLSKLESVKVPSLETVASAPILKDGPTALQKTGALEALFPVENLYQEVAKVENAWRSVSKEIEDEIARLGVTEEEKRLLEVVRLIGGVKDKVERIRKAADVEALLTVMRDMAKKIYETFSETKRTKVTQIYQRIQGDIRKYYSLLHPGEAHTDVTLRLRTGQRASTELRIKSFGREDEDPRALTSEGHLDSLGLCIFLAFVRNFNADCTLIILDDVVTTIDSGHRKRICDLLLEEFKDYQIVITTQDGIWYRELAATQRALRLEDAFLNLEIASWSLETGPRIERFMPRIEEIEYRLQANDKIAAGNETRTYLEWLLKKIALATNASVPAVNWQSGTVGDLEPSVRGRMRSLIADSTYVALLEAAFSNLEKTVIFGNLLSHDNVLADQISLAEVHDFFQAVRELHHGVSCSSCGILLTYVKDVREYRCRNKRCKTPLILPTK